MEAEVVGKRVNRGGGFGLQIPVRHWCSPVNLLHIFRTPFPKNTSGWLLLHISISSELNFVANGQTSYVIMLVQGLIKKLRAVA